MLPDARGTAYRFVRWRWRALFAIVDWCGWRAAIFVRAIGRRVGYQTNVPSSFQDPRRILVIQLDHLGDTVISLPFFASLRERFPGSSIEVLCSPWNAGLLRMASGIDRLHVLGWNRFARDWRGRTRFWLPALFYRAWRLRRRQFDLAIDVRGDFPHAVLMWLAGAGRRIGWNCGGGGFLLTDSPEYVAQRAEVESRLAILRLISAAPIAAHATLLEPGDLARSEIEHRLSNDAATARPLVVMHIGAGTTAKCWPVEHWRELIGRLIHDDQPRIILVGGGEDRRRAATILASVQAYDAHRAEPTGSEPLAEDWTGRLSLAELTALAERASVFVGGDSGPAHLTAAVGTPVVVLFSGTNRAKQWQPAGNFVTVLQHSVACSPCFCVHCPVPGHPCMQGLLPADVADAVRRSLLRSNRLKRHSHDVNSIPYPLESGQP